MRIRQAQVQDTGTVSSILQEAAQWPLHQGTPLWKENELATDRIRDEVSGGLFRVAAVSGEIAGRVRFRSEATVLWPDVTPDESAFIHCLAVRRQRAGGTVSRKFIEWAALGASKSRETVPAPRLWGEDNETLSDFRKSWFHKARRTAGRPLLGGPICVRNESRR